MDNEGFSLIEVIVSVAIIAVLATFFLRGFGEASLLNRRTADRYKAEVAAGNEMEYIKAVGVADYVGTHDFAANFIKAVGGTKVEIAVANEEDVVSPTINAIWYEAKDNGGFANNVERLTLLPSDGVTAITVIGVRDKWVEIAGSSSGTTCEFTAKYYYMFEYEGAAGGGFDTVVYEKALATKTANANGKIDALFVIAYDDEGFLSITADVVDVADHSYIFPQGLSSWSGDCDVFGFDNIDETGLSNDIKDVNCDLIDILPRDGKVVTYAVTVTSANGTKLVTDISETVK